MQEAAASAIDALRAGRDDEAIAKLNDVVTKLPTCSDCYYNLGLAYTHKQQWPEAEAALKKAIELKPTNPDPYNGLANVYNAQKKFDDALAMNQKATELAGRRRAPAAAATPKRSTTRAWCCSTPASTPKREDAVRSGDARPTRTTRTRSISSA